MRQMSYRNPRGRVQDSSLGTFEIENVIIRFAGDSGDGIQTTGALFSHDSAIAGHDISTLPDFPAEIRAPAGTLAGVSNFQLNFSSYDIHTPGDRPGCAGCAQSRRTENQPERSKTRAVF